MAIRYRTAAGNWSNAAQWDGGTLPGAADDCYANSFITTIDQDVSVLSLTNASNASPAIAAGGQFSVATIPGGGRSITANIECTNTASSTLAVSATANTLTITGNVTRGNTGNGGSALSLSTNGGSSVVINGTVTGGAGGGNSQGISSSGNIGNLTVNGNVVGSASAVGINFATTVARTLAINGTVNNNGLTVSGGGTGNTVSVSNLLNTTAGITNQCVTIGGTIATLTLATTANVGASSICPLASLTYTSGAGTFNINGGGGTLACSSTVSMQISCSLTGTASLTVNCSTVTGPVANSQNAATITQSGAGTVTVNCTTAQGGTGTYAFIASAVANSGAGLVVVNGNVVGAASGGGQPGAVNNSSGTLTINGTALGGTSTAAAAHGVLNLAAGVVNVTKVQSNDYPNGGNTQIAYGASGSNWNGWFVVDSMEDGSGGVPAYTGRCYVRAGSNGQVKMRESNAGTIKTFGANPTDYPVAANVRDGTVYNSGASTGTLKVPPAGSVALGVPVDNTVGSAVLNGVTLAQIEGSAVLAMKAHVDGVPAAVRINLATELGRLDAAVSSRLATVGYTAPDNSGIAAIAAAIAALPAAVRTNLATELARIDASVTSRLPASSYAAPLNAAATEAAVVAGLTTFDAPAVADLLGVQAALEGEHETTHEQLAAIARNAALVPGLL